MTLRFEPVLADGIAQVSYFVCDDSAGCAAVIDPRPDADIYLEKARQYGATITHVFETHIHADFMSGAREVVHRCAGSARLHVSVEGGASYDFEHEAVRDGDRFEFGEVRITARKTPGHTPEHLSYLLTDPSKSEQPWGVLTGDSLFVDSLGRPDLLGDEKTDELTEALYDTMREFFCKLDDDVIIYPCHAAGSACGPDIGDRMSSTIGYEKKYNPYMQIDNYEEFKEAIQGNAPPVPTHYPKMKKLNARGPEVYGHTPHVRPLSVSEFESATQSPEVIVLDTRDMLAFGGGHIAGALNIGKRPILSVWAGWLIDTDAPIYLVLNEDEQDLVEVVNLLWRTGHTNIRGYLAGGMRNWQEAGKALMRMQQLSVHELAEQSDKYLPLDVRKDEEWNGGHVPGATHHFLGEFHDSLPSLDKNRKIATYCASGYRASIASSLLQKHGFENVYNVPGSFSAWQAAGKPIEKPGEDATGSGLRKVSDDIYIAEFDPDEQSFESFATKGIRSVINLQSKDESQETSDDRERQLAAHNNLEYRHIGVTKDRLSDELVDRFRHELEAVPKPVVVHCTSGKRSGALVMMHLGSEQGLSGDTVIDKAEKMGFDCNEGDMAQFVKNYVNTHEVDKEPVAARQ